MNDRVFISCWVRQFLKDMDDSIISLPGLFLSQPFMFVWLLLKNESLVLKPRINLSVAERVSRLMDGSKGMNPNPRHRTSMASPVSGTGD